MRNLLKHLPTANSKPTLRERFTAMKAKAGGFTSETSKGRRAVLAGSLASAVPLPALAASGPIASDGRADYLARLLTAYAEDRACRPVADVAVYGSIEEAASDLVMQRCVKVCMEILALPTPRALDGFALATIATALMLEGSFHVADMNGRAAIAMTRAALAFTGAALPPGFIGFGDEADSSDRDDALFAAKGSLPAWAIAEAKASRAAADEA